MATELTTPPLTEHPVNPSGNPRSTHRRGPGRGGAADDETQSQQVHNSDAGLSTPRITGAQVTRLIIGVIWLGFSQQWFFEPLRTPAPGLTLLAGAIGMVTILSALLVRGDRWEQRLDIGLLAGSLLFLLLYVVAATYSTFASDEVAFGQQAAVFLLHGHDPYTASYATTFHTYGVSYGTPTLGGGKVTQLSYPAASFLLLVPFVLLLGAHSYAYIGAVYLGVAASVWMLARSLPRQVWPAFALLFILPPVQSLLLNDLDFLYLPFLIASYRWLDSFQDPAHNGVARWLSPLLLGAACSVKQNPWFLVPFVLVMAVMIARSRGQNPWTVGARYAGAVALAFLAINLPFIIWSPSGWVAGTLHPLITAAVPWGIGFGTLLLLWGTGSYAWFGLAGVIAWVAALLVYLRFYSRLWMLGPLLAVLPLLFTNRNPAQYFTVAPFLCVFVGAVLRVPPPPMVRGRRTLSLAAVVAGCAAVAISVAGLAMPSPLSVRVLSASATTDSFTATVGVMNRGTRAMAPHFIVTVGVIPDEPATVMSGPARIRPGTRAVYVIRAAEMSGMPSRGSTTTFEIDATTASPNTFVSSPVATYTG